MEDEECGEWVRDVSCTVREVIEMMSVLRGEERED